RALQYVKAFNGIILNHPHDKHIAGNGQIHEGRVSTRLGMKGIPALSEELMLQRDIELLDYSNSRLHVHNISTVESVSLIRRAKDRGLRITASVAADNLAFIEEDVSKFDTNLKILPPLRASSDRTALKKGLSDGTIDFVCSNHVPLEREAKFLEFPYAKFGAIALQTAVASSIESMKEHLSVEQMIEKWAYGSRKALSLSVPIIKKGEKANLTLFDPNRVWEVSSSTLYSKSKNSSFTGKELRGKTILNINKGRIWKAD
ncbi:MAG: dihydroorotase, partial [Bacteroidota bacterium]